MILLLTATAFEQDLLARALGNPEPRAFAHRRLTEGEINGRPVALLETGIGAVNTAQALTAALQAFQPAPVLQIGVGGAYLPSGLNVGDLALATEETDGESGVLVPGGWQPLQAIGIPLLRKDRDYFNCFPLDATRVERAAETLRNASWDDAPPAIRTGPFVTVQQCTGRAERGNELAARFSGICETMEGAAAAHLCTLYGVPFLELRGISNRVEDRNRDAWNLPLAARRAQEAALHLLAIPDL